MDEEVWLPVVGYEQSYDVSSHGRIRRRETGRPAYRGRILSQRAPGGTYLQVSLWKDATCRRMSVHVVVAEAFLGPRPQGYQVDHMNGVKIDNRTANLRWVTASENSLSSVVRDGRRGERIHTTKLDASLVRCIRLRAANGEHQRDLAREFGVSQSTVTFVVTRKHWRWVE